MLSERARLTQKQVSSNLQEMPSLIRDGTRIFQSGPWDPNAWSDWGPNYFGWIVLNVIISDFKSKFLHPGMH